MEKMRPRNAEYLSTDYQRIQGKLMQKPISVIHIITRLIIGGAQENTIYTVELLDKKGFKSSIISGPQTGSEGSLIEEAQERGVQIKILPSLLREISPLNDVITMIKLVRIFRQEPVDIIHTHSSKAGILGRFAAHVAGIPIIIHTVHGWSFHDFMSPILRQIYIILERWAASLTDALIVVTQKDIQKGLESRIGKPEKYHLIRSAIPLEQFKSNQFTRDSLRNQLDIPKDAIVIGNVGRFSPQKNPLDWVKIAGEIGRKNPLVYFLLVGDGPLRQEVEMQIEKENLSNRFILTGLRRDIPEILSVMDIFLITSLWEGLPRVIPQAMSMRLPVVSNRADGTNEVIQDGVNGFLCDPGDIDCAVKICQGLISNPILRQEIGQKGHNTVCEEFNLENMIQQIEQLYIDQLSKKE
jgi:glycosyltransferase involved in cell wall biosynthesis